MRCLWDVGATHIFCVSEGCAGRTAFCGCFNLPDQRLLSGEGPHSATRSCHPPAQTNARQHRGRADYLMDADGHVSPACTSGPDPPHTQA